MAEVQFIWTAPDPLNKEAKTKSVYLTELYAATNIKEKEAGLPISSFVNSSKGEKFKALSINQLKGALSNPPLLDNYGWGSVEEILGRGWYTLEKDSKTGKEKWCYHILNDFRDVLNNLVAVTWEEKWDTVIPTYQMYSYNLPEFTEAVPGNSSFYHTFNGYYGYRYPEADAGTWRTFERPGYRIYYYNGRGMRTIYVTTSMNVDSKIFTSGCCHMGKGKIDIDYRYGNRYSDVRYDGIWTETEGRFIFTDNHPNHRYLITKKTKFYWDAAINLFNAVTKWDYGGEDWMIRQNRSVVNCGIGVSSYHKETNAFTGSVSYFTQIPTPTPPVPPTYFSTPGGLVSAGVSGRNLYDDLNLTDGNSYVSSVIIYFWGKVRFDMYLYNYKYTLYGCGNFELEGKFDNIKITNLKKVAYP